MGSEENKALVRAMYEYVDRGSLDYIDKYLAADFQFHNNGVTLDLAAYREAMSALFIACSKVRHEMHFMVAEGDMVAVVMTAHLAHTGEFLGVDPTGRTVTAPINSVFRIQDEKLAEVWNVIDMDGLRQQLEAVSEG